MDRGMDGDLVGDAGEDAPARRDVGRVETREDGQAQRVEVGGEAVGQGAALGREVEAPHPAVRPVGVAAQEARRAELVDRPHQRRGLDAERVGDLVLLAAAPARDEDQRQGRRFRQAVRPHHDVGEPAPFAGRAEQVEAVALEVLGDHGGSDPAMPRGHIDR